MKIGDENAIVDSGTTVTLVSPVTASLLHCHVKQIKQPFNLTYAGGMVAHPSTIAKIGGVNTIVDTNITEPLIAVNNLVDTGNEVIFSHNSSFVRRVESGQVWRLKRNDDTRLWEMSMRDFARATTPQETEVSAAAVTQDKNNEALTLLRNYDFNLNASDILVERVNSDYDKRLLKALIRLHIIMGHPSGDNMYIAIHNGMWLNTGIDAADVRRLWSTYKCLACIMAKSNAIPVSQPSDPRTQVPGHTISVDPSLVSPKGPNGEQWIFLFKDVATRYWAIYLTKVKSDFPIVLSSMIKWLAARGHPMRILRTDDEVVLQSAEVMQILEDNGGIQAQYSVPYQHHQNTVERDYQTLIKSVSALMYGQNLLKQWMWILLPTG